MLHSAALAHALLLAEPSLTLDWQAPSECPDAAGVRVMTLDLLRRQVSDEPTPPVDVRAAVTRAEDRWRVTIALRSPFGRVDRTLTATGCPLLARATALIIAVHLDPAAVSRALGPLLDPPVPPTLPPEPPTDLSPRTAMDPPPVEPPACVFRSTWAPVPLGIWAGVPGHLGASERSDGLSACAAVGVAVGW